MRYYVFELNIISDNMIFAKLKPYIVYRHLDPLISTGLYCVVTLVFITMAFVMGLGIGLLHNQEINQISVALPTPTLYSSNTTIDGENNTITPQLTTDWNPSAEEWEKESQCLAQNIYFEARDQSIKGKIAVGLVTLNRLESSKFPNTICKVVWEKRRHPKTKKWVGQFSWTWDGKSDTPKNMTAWSDAKRIADGMIAENHIHNIQDFTQTATHYHAIYVQPYWSKIFFVVNRIDDHIFYTVKEVKKNTVVTVTL